MDGTIVAFDVQRMLIGDAPLSFHFEILFRTIVVYAYALVLLRWLGSRTIGQLSTVEFLLVIALGSAVGDPMFYPDVPLLHALLVVTIVVVANKGLDMLIAASKAAERVVDGEPMRLIDKGVISQRFIEAQALGHSEMFQLLRRHGIKHLGEVRAAYVEPNGEVTVFRREGSVPKGLPIEPPWEIEKPSILGSDDTLGQSAALACMNCGTTRDVLSGQSPGTCPNCEHDKWTPAVEDDRSRTDS